MMGERELIPFNPDDLTPDQIQYVQNKLLARQAEMVHAKLIQLEDEQKKLRAELSIVRDEQSKTMEVAANSLRVQHGYMDFISQGDFGRFFSISISAVDVGKLFKVVGLAMPSKGRTTPYREYVPKYAKTVAKESYTDLKWHYTNCMEFIDKWLKKNEHYDRFYSIQSESEMSHFINQLYGEMM